MDLKLYCIRPHESYRHTHTVIFLHGRDSTAIRLSEDLLDGQNSQGRHLQDIFPSIRWVFAQSEKRYSAELEREITQWFDVCDLRNPAERPDLQLEGLRQNAAKLILLIKSEAATVGGLRRVILAGFCQGFATAVHALLNLRGSNDQPMETQNRLGALIGLSSWMALPAASVSSCRGNLALQPGGASANVDVYRDTPVFLSHAANDDVVPVEQGRKLRDILRGYGMDVVWKEFETGGHWIYGSQDVDDIVDFLKSQGLPEHTPLEE
ncbi:hypothetical protein DL770_004295 [Monosporascus sp. CRB-9-2]|nr:hypothetical protein DL770_004295 [Monosporascus sp. CRB-9-2]